MGSEDLDTAYRTLAGMRAQVKRLADELDKVRDCLPPSGDLFTEEAVALRVQAELASLKAERDELRGALDALALAREQDRSRLEAVLAEPDEETVRRLGGLLMQQIMGGVLPVDVVRAILADLRRRAGVTP